MRQSFRVDLVAEIHLKKRVVAHSKQEAEEVAQHRVQQQIDRLCMHEDYGRSFVGFDRSRVIRCNLTGRKV